MRLLEKLAAYAERSKLLRSAAMLLVVSALALPATAADSYDPGDDTTQGATLLPDPIMANQANGPHTCGSSDEADWFRVRLIKGVGYFFDSIGGTGDPAAEIYDETGTTLLGSNDDADGYGLMFVLFYTATYDGYYLIKVRPFANISSSYSFQYGAYNLPDAWDPGDDTSQTATLFYDLTQTDHEHGPHTLNLNDPADWFKIYLFGLRTVTISAVNGLTVSLYDANGRPLGSGSQQINYIPRNSGYYYVQVSGFSTGPYYLKYTSPYLTAGDIELTSADFSPVAPTAAHPGSLLNLSWSGNNPYGAIAGQMWFEMFASKTGGFDNERLGTGITGSAHIDMSEYPTTFTINSSDSQSTPQYLEPVPDGVYTLVGYANRRNTGGPDEGNYANNSVPIAGKRLFVHNTTTATCDLAWETTPTIVLDGQSVTVNGVIENIGPESSPGNGFWIETLYGALTPEGSFNIGGYAGGGKKITTPLAAGTTVSYSFSGSVPPGNWAIAALIDSTDIVPETDERNNASILGSPPVGSGDLDLEMLSASIMPGQLAPAELHTGDILNWKCTVRNNSTSASGSVWFELFPSSNGGLGALRTGSSLTASEQRSIDGGETVEISFAQAVNDVTDGIYSVVAVVNRQATGGPADPNPVNNRIILPGRIFLHHTASPTANLRWSAGPFISTVANQLSVTGTVINDGTTASGPFWTEAFYGSVSAEAIYYKQGALGGGIYTTNLDTSATVVISAVYSVPAGNWTYGVITDSTDIVPESDETDNYAYP